MARMDKTTNFDYRNSLHALYRVVEKSKPFIPHLKSRIKTANIAIYFS